MQDMTEEIKRLFFGLSVHAPWPMSYPNGRIIEEESRHITLAFLGNHPFAKLKQELQHFPSPEFPIGPVGICDELLFLPVDKPRVVAHHISWLTDGEKIESLHLATLDWLEKLGYHVDRRPFLSHLSIARSPFQQKEWKEVFEILPVLITGVHLYESMGNLRYSKIWSLPFLSAFEEFEHTADIAFHLRGLSFSDLYFHGALAMSFKFPPFLEFLKREEMRDLNHVIQALNLMISSCDLEMGCPFKAVSYHGKVKEEKGLLQWEMVVDV
ncbi:MAG: RNA 2',3'-cyclic phosphodiesterase [Chlamydiae bacterium]|nr:RNA 2',3'-cyclic phosphodiesterase [Chlamydiota bacterium]